MTNRIIELYSEWGIGEWMEWVEGDRKVTCNAPRASQVRQWGKKGSLKGKGTIVVFKMVKNYRALLIKFGKAKEKKHKHLHFTKTSRNGEKIPDSGGEGGGGFFFQTLPVPSS